jgi:hypothetical protein
MTSILGSAGASAGAAATATPGSNLAWPPIPAWEIQSLQNLAAKGQLYGIPPQIIAYIDSAESSGNTGGSSRSSTGYGGWFGLKDNTAYPGGTLTSAQLNDTTPAGFALQAQIAASEFASLLTKNGGNPLKAEQAYQGSTTGDGTKIFEKYVSGLTITPGPGGNVDTSSGTGGSATTSKSGACDDTVYLINASPFHFINQCQAQEILGVALIAVGAITLVAGLWVLLKEAGLNSVAATVGRGLGRGESVGTPPATPKLSGSDSAARSRYDSGEGRQNRQFYRSQTQPRMTTREPRPHRVSGTSTPDF